MTTQAVDADNQRSLTSLIFGKKKMRDLNGEDNMCAGKMELMPP